MKTTQECEEDEQFRKFLKLIDNHFAEESARKLREMAEVLVASHKHSSGISEPAPVALAKILNLIASYSFNSPEKLQSLSNFLVTVGDTAQL